MGRCWTPQVWDVYEFCMIVGVCKIRVLSQPCESIIRKEHVFNVFLVLIQQCPG